MELAALKAFLHVAATGSFSRAAALLRSTQSAVSKRIGTLEHELSARLFERTGRGARLTDAGRLLLPRAEALTAEADGLADLIRGGRDTPRGSVRIAVQPSMGWPLIGDLVTATQARYPGIRLQIAEGTTGQIEEWLTDGRLDLGVLSTAPLHVEAQPLFVVPSLLVARAGDPEVRRATVPFARLATLPIVIATMPNGGRVLIEEEARRRGIALNVVLEVNSIHLIKRLVARGGSYTLASPPAVAAEIAAGELAAARVVRPEILQTFYLALGGRRPAGAAVSALATIIRELTMPRGPGQRTR
jgi:LysR family transcriptional regulator, nitrogen assimilation regulatory protein